MVRDKTNSLPPASWYRSMDMLFVHEKLLEAKERIDFNETEYASFERWCELMMVRYGWLGLEWFVETFQNSDDPFLLAVQAKRCSVAEWSRIRKTVFERDDFTCKYCGRVGGILEVDHIVPVSKGGTDNLDNLATACRKCNRQKKDKRLDEFMTWREMRGGGATYGRASAQGAD